VEYGCGTLDKAGQVVNTTNAQYLATSKSCTPFSVQGLMYTGSSHQLWEQFRAAIFVIFWSALVTFILMNILKLVLGGVRYKDEILEVGDLAIHDEEAFPEEALAHRVGGFAMASGSTGEGQVTVLPGFGMMSPTLLPPPGPPVTGLTPAGSTFGPFGS
jgi:Ammonium Transporter Family